MVIIPSKNGWIKTVSSNKEYIFNVLEANVFLRGRSITKTDKMLVRRRIVSMMYSITIFIV